MSAALRFSKLATITTLAMSAPIGSLARAQQHPPAKSEAIPRKDPNVATISSVLIPGAGQFYTERYGKAAMIFAGTGAGIAIAVDASAHKCNPFGHCGSNALQVISMSAAAVIWGFGWATAGRDARLFNNQMLNHSSFAPFIDRRDGRLLAGLTLRSR